jgi:hypothetical protein
VRTFFGGSSASAMAALPGPAERFSDAELERMAVLIEAERAER